MFKKIFEIARLYLAITYRSRTMLIFGIALPLIFTMVIGQAITPPEPSEDSATWTVDVVNQDQGQLGDKLVSALDANTSIAVIVTDMDTALAEVEAQDVAAVLALPPDFSELVISGEDVNVQFYMNLSEPMSAQVVEAAVGAALSEVGSWVVIAESSREIAERLGLFDMEDAPEPDAYFTSALSTAQEELDNNPLLVVESYKGTRALENGNNIPDGIGQTSPGMMVIFTMFSVLGGAASLLLEREQGTLRRLLVMPLSKGMLMAGKLTGIYIAGVIQISILILAGQFLFGVDWGQSIAALAVMVLAFAFCITSLSIMVAALVRTFAQVDAMSALIVIPLSGLGGAMWPIEIVPEFMRKIAMFVPTGWAMQGFHDIISRGWGMADILQEAGVLALFGIVFLTVGVSRFRYE